MAPQTVSKLVYSSDWSAAFPYQGLFSCACERFLNAQVSSHVNVPMTKYLLGSSPAVGERYVIFLL